MKANEEEKVFKTICENYSEGTPLDACITKAEWGTIQFYKYISEKPEREAEFETAKAFFATHQENNIVSIALNSFQRLIAGYTEIEYQEEYVPSYNEDGKEIARKVTKRIEKSKHFQPSPQLVQFALEKLLPNKYSQPSKLLPDAPKHSEVQVYKIGKQIIKFT